MARGRSVIRVRGAHKVYLQADALEVPPRARPRDPAGELVAAHGPSGGKSTFLRGRHARRPTHGPCCSTRGVFAVAGRARDFRTRRSASSSRATTCSELTALENAMMPALVRRSRAPRRVAAEEMLALVGLEDPDRPQPGELSGGASSGGARAAACA